MERNIQSRPGLRNLAVVTATAALGLGLTGMVDSAAEAKAPADATEVRADFNGDAIADLAIGVPLEDVNGRANAGAVNVIYGGAAGLTAAGNQLWTENSAGILGVSEAGDQFGSSLASGDFNGDGFTDLAVGVPLEDQFFVNDGVVHVIYGSAAGLTFVGNQLWSQNSAGIGAVSAAGDQFGFSLAAANLGRTAQDDLAIGVPLDDIGAANAGVVNVIYGTAAGLNAAGNQVWSQNSAGIGAVSAVGDQFGFSLAAANLGRSFHADLAIGVPLDDIGAVNAGVVNVIYGTAAGLNAAGNQVWSQNSAGIGAVSAANDRFGHALAAADLGRSFHADLAIGVPLDDIGAVNAGVVNVIYGTAAGLNAAGNQVWSQNSAGIGAVSAANDQFGYSLTAANFGRTVFGDLAIGVPFDDIGAVNAGVVNVIYGTAAGLNAAGNQVWSQNSAGIAGVSAAGDLFGYSLASANLGRSFHADLAIGVPLDDVGAVNAGVVNVIYGTAVGLNPAANQLWSQNSAGILGVSAVGDSFGRSLTARR